LLTSSMLFRSPPDHPGALVELLPHFAVRDVNLARLESRATGGGLGAYCFFMDAEGRVAEARIGEALMGLRRICRDVRFLGSYPRSDAGMQQRRPRARVSTTDDDFHEAERWLARIRAGQVD